MLGYILSRTGVSNILQQRGAWAQCVLTSVTQPNEDASLWGRNQLQINRYLTWLLVENRYIHPQYVYRENAVCKKLLPTPGILRPHPTETSVGRSLKRTFSRRPFPQKWGLQASWSRDLLLPHFRGFGDHPECWERVSREQEVFQAGRALSVMSRLVPQIDVFLSLEVGEEERGEGSAGGPRWRLGWER